MPSGSNAMTAMPLAPHLPLVLIGSGAQKCQMTMAKTKDNPETRPHMAGSRRRVEREGCRGSVASAVMAPA